MEFPSVNVNLVTPVDPLYPNVCDFARQTYEARLACTLQQFYPAYLVYQEGEAIRAVVGHRSAGIEPLFVEHYLDAPVEQHLVAARDTIVELGCFAAENRLAAFNLMAGSARYLDEQGYTYVVCAANRAIRQCLKKLGIEIQVLGDVDPARVPGGGAAWGNYYEGDPQVLGGSIKAGVKAINALFGVAA